MKIFRNPWWIVFGSVLGLIVGNVTILQFSTSVLMKPIMAEFGWSRTIPSAAVGLGTLCAALATPFVGRMIDRRGVRSVTLASIVLFSLATAAMALTPAAAFVFLGMFAAVGMFSAGQAPLPYAQSIAAAFDQRRGLALGVAMTGVGLGAALMPMLAQAFLESFGWRGAFIALGATVFLVSFPAVALFLRDVGERARAGGAGLPGLEAREVVRSGNFWILALVFTCIPVVANGVIFHIVALLTDRGITAESAVIVFTVIGPSLIVGRLLCGYFLDRFHAPYVAVVFIALPALGVLVLLSGYDPKIIAMGAVLVGLGLGAEVDLIGYLQSRYFGLRAFGQVYGYLFAIFTIGAAIGPFVMGAAFDTFGSYRPILIVFLMVLLVAAGAVVRLPRAYPYPVVRPSKPSVESLATVAGH
ncbi:MFS transporter [Pusillimonas noertemannii]|uniref:Cyanate permease n=1 Tax=Pusillimonas noertemannii TaxID=305977 RepID=A0A2U1CKV1_9BURK|nr:MFS transporter [Pusillimonas noertemannii]PVY61627.1 cyanate permease [Pusillimonas noertemannii]